MARTRRDVLDAFRDLMLERGYARTTVQRIIERANVGRSTFYEHFENKADVLRCSLAPIFTPLADTIAPAHDAALLERVLAHMWENRRMAGVTLLGPTRPLATRLLADLLHERLQHRSRAAAASAPSPLPLAAAALAEMQIGLLAGWLSEAIPSRPADVMRALERTSNAAAAALLDG